MFGDKKKLADDIVASSLGGEGAPPMGEEPVLEGEASELDPGLEAAADDLMSAIASGDKLAFVDAFRAMSELCCPTGIAPEEPPAE